jgi:hypothetical protein
MTLKYRLINFLDIFRYDIPRFLHNIIRFRKLLWWHYNFDAHSTILAMKVSLEICQKCMIEPRHVGDEKRQKKMLRAIELLTNAYDDNYIEQAEKILGYEVKGHAFKQSSKEDNTSNRKIFDLADELEIQQWAEIFEILKGQNYHDFKYEDDPTKTPMENHEIMEKCHEEWYDGSGLKNWWH